MNYKRVLVVALLLSLGGLSVAQQHAPTLATCQADARLWYDLDRDTEYKLAETGLIRDNTPNKTEVGKMALRVVLARESEMNDCFFVSGRQDMYKQAMDFYESVHMDRLYRFCQRHRFMAQVLDEDDAGLR